MLDERMDGARFFSDNRDYAEPVNDELREAEEMHNRSINILADHLRISPAEAEQRLESYLADGTGIDKSDERLARMISMAKKTLSTLQSRKQQSNKI